MDDFPNDDKLGECKDCDYYEVYEQDGTMGHCSRIHGMLGIHDYPPVHETCWCPFFVES